MERMQSSGDQATAAAASGGADDFMAEMMKALGSGDFGAEGGEEGEDFSKMLMGMMEQLTNKEILYEPMKELHDKFPEWMEKNKDKTPEADMARYETQKAVVAEIVAKFEESTYKDSNPADREYIVDRMQKVCCSEEYRDAQLLTYLSIDASARLATLGLGWRHGLGTGCFRWCG
jgi:peroxin-19